MRNWAAMCLGCVVACAVGVSGQRGLPRSGLPVPGGGTRAQPTDIVTARIYPQLMHLRFTKSVTAPPQTPPGGEQDIRAHLESPVLATVNGSTQKVVVIPSDVDVNLQVRLIAGNAQQTIATLHLQVMSANVDPAEGRRQFISAEVYHDFPGWPRPGDVLIPAGATMSIPLVGEVRGIPQANLASTDPNANRPDDGYPSRPILASISLPIALVDQQIDVTNAGANKLFRARLTEDMDYTVRVPLPVGAINLTRGTEVYVRSYERDPSAPYGHVASWSVDFVVVDGKRIPVRGIEERAPFNPGALAIASDGKRKVPVVLWSVGQTRRFLIAEQQEVFANGTTLWTYPTTTDVASGSAAPASTQSTSAPNAPSPSAPAGLPSDLRQRVEENRKRAQELAACQQQAIKDHRNDPAGLTQALAACNPRDRK
jgi:hypothetical protein